MMKRNNRRGDFNTLSAAAPGLLVFVIVGAVGALVLSNFQEQTCKTNGNTYINGECYSTYTNATSNTVNRPGAYNMTVTGLSATNDLVGWAPIIVVVVAGILILGYFGMKGWRQ